MEVSPSAKRKVDRLLRKSGMKNRNPHKQTKLREEEEQLDEARAVAGTRKFTLYQITEAMLKARMRSGEIQKVLDILTGKRKPATGGAPKAPAKKKAAPSATDAIKSKIETILGKH